MEKQKPAESADWILSKLIKDPDYFAEISDQLKPWHFEGEKKKLYELLTQGIERVPKKGINYEPIKDETGAPVLETRYTPTTVNIIETKYAGNSYFSYLTSLDAPSLKEMTAHVNNHLTHLMCSKLISIHNNAMVRLQSGCDIDEVSREFEELKMELERSHSNESLVATSKDAYDKLVDQTHEKIKTGQKKVSTGFSVLDYLLAGGIEPGDFFVLASKTGQGKSMFTLQTAYNMATRLGKRVGILSLEMDEAENLKRIWTHFSFAHRGFGGDVKFYQSNFEQAFKKLHNNKAAWEDFQEVEAKILSELPVYYLKPKDITLAEMKKYCNLFYERYQCDVILLDHMLLVSDKQEERLIVKDIANFMKVFAAEKKIITMAVSQMNRGTRKEALDDMNSVDDLSGGRSIEQAASQIVTISRLPKTDQNPYAKEAHADNENVRKISLIKSRHSKDNTHFYCDFFGNSATFREIHPDNWQDVKDLEIPTQKLEYSEFES